MEKQHHYLYKGSRKYEKKKQQEKKAKSIVNQTLIPELVGSNGIWILTSIH
jgi:hypothetical protein